MIMAGRGKRLGDLGDSNKPIGVPAASATEESTLDLPTLITKINEINVTDTNALNTLQITNSFKKLCTSKDVMKDILSQLHEKALNDSSFSDKLLVAFEEVFNFQIDDVRVRNELLQFMQNDFAAKDSFSQLERNKLLNAIILLGCGFRRIKVCGKPISILGLALFEYFELLLKGDEDDLKALATQILFNGEQLSLEDKLSDKYILLQHNLRTTLMTKDLNFKSKCWILLSIDFISNNFKPLTGAIKDFYVKELKEEYTKLQLQIKVPSGVTNHVFSSPESVKSQDSSSRTSKSFDSPNKKKDAGKKDSSEKFSGMSLKVEDKRGKGKSFGRERKWQGDEKPPRSKGNSVSGHDDRFEKDENFYGVQAPRRPKTEKPRKSPGDTKGKKSGDDSKTVSETPNEEEKNKENSKD